MNDTTKPQMYSSPGMEYAGLGLQGAGLLASVYGGMKADELARAQMAEEQRRYDQGAWAQEQAGYAANARALEDAQRRNAADVEARRKALLDAYAHMNAGILG